MFVKARLHDKMKQRNARALGFGTKTNRITLKTPNKPNVPRRAPDCMSLHSGRSKMLEKSPAVHKSGRLSKVRGLNFHAHEDPFVAGDVQVMRPMIQSGQLKANPLQALGQLDCLISRHATIDASDYAGAVKWTIG